MFILFVFTIELVLEVQSKITIVKGQFHEMRNNKTSQRNIHLIVTIRRLVSREAESENTSFIVQGMPYTKDAGLPYFDRAAVLANGTWLCGTALKSMGAKFCFRSCLVNIGPSYT